MSDHPRLQHLLEELRASRVTPEEVCASCPELLPQVRERWQRMRYVRDEIDALFPPPLDPALGAPAVPLDGTALPAIPGYEVEAVLGVGGMGVVFRARHLRLNRVVALKMALAGAYTGPHERVRFQREAEAVARLTHPNVVQIYEVGDSDGRPYFTMEFVAGGSLAQKLAGTPRAAREAAVLLATLAGAVHAAHQSGIVHRDLKPANVLLTTDGGPKIGDFGLARVGGEAGLTRTGTAVGTPSYMAPEQARGASDAVGPPVDIYALGAILYELLTGRPPFRAETGAETVHQVLSQDPVPPSRLNGKVPRDLETVCLKCLRKEARLRYATAAALADDLARYLRGEPISARPEGPLARLVRRVRRRPVLSAALAVSTLLTGALVGGGAWTLSERAANERAVGAERAARERAADDDLRDMVRWLKTSAWPEAAAARERAKIRLGDRGSSDLHRRMDQGARELALAARLDAIRLDRAVSPESLPGRTQADQEYEAAFREAGVSRVYEDPELVAARVRASNIPGALTDAIDDWNDCAIDSPRRVWLRTVAGSADPDPTGWRARARDPKTWRNEAALAEVMAAGLKAGRCEPLLLGLARHWNAIWKDPVPFLNRVQQAHPGDLFANLTLAERLVQKNNPAEAVRYFQAALAIRPGAAGVCNNFGLALGQIGRSEEAAEQLKRAVEFAPTSSLYRLNLARGLLALGEHDAALDQGQRALELDPLAARTHWTLGDILAANGRFDGAVAAYRRAVALEPKLGAAQHGLRATLMRQGCPEEARIAWRAALDSDFHHDAWYGYAELCLFLGREDEYRWARRGLLDRFGEPGHQIIGERVSRACLLAPAAGDELRRAVTLAEYVAKVDRSKDSPWTYPFFLFVRGLAEYRQGRFDLAIATMRGEASRVLGPAPGLVLAMALHRGGEGSEARKTLAAAVLGHDWRADRVRDQDDWIYHVLRREAEGLIVPELPQFLDGKYQPRDNDERLAFLGVCQFTNRTRAAARLYADAFAAAPRLADDFRAGHRYSGARYAARAGWGRGTDAGALGEPERSRWRAQAREWLRADLAAWGRALDGDPVATRASARQKLTQWRAEPDLAGVREPAELAELPAEERNDCLALWDEVGGVLKRTSGDP